ncbi:Pr6Pr family membrane protein [Spiroplasma alleghenense]|uniref:Transmembrane protein n=1 Tax=Spiroplasma alleghenense TaxID=216931 RepID=A0A345Z4A6_9MOLU|nr:Pr6Pr family membrane protein [Spiroplasma alleghenense]AXK51435.1 hypothetical protein SALLE_v1c07650 [Spiroplasma alleghenense]
MEFKKFYQSLKFYFCFLSGLLVSLTLIISYLYGLINISEIRSSNGLTQIWKLDSRINGLIIFDREGYTINFLFYFTTQINILISCALFYLAFYQNEFNNKFYLTRKVYTGICVYAFLMLFIFWTFLIPDKIKLSAWEIVKQIVIHLIGPVCLIFATLYWFKSYEFVRHKIFFKKDLWKIYIYPIIYLILTLIRGEFRYLANKPLQTQYPYFFLHIHSKRPIKEIELAGWEWLLIIVTIIIILLPIFSHLLNFLLNKINHKSKVK